MEVEVGLFVCVLCFDKIDEVVDAVGLLFMRSTCNGSVFDIRPDRDNLL